MQAVIWLWEIVNELDDEERRRFLKFFTGSDRAPIGGLGNLRSAFATSEQITAVLHISYQLQALNWILGPHPCVKNEGAALCLA